jgi:hypothetical protein
VKPLAFGLGELALGEVGQFEIVEEKVDKFVAAQNEAERIFAIAFAGIGRYAAAFTPERGSLSPSTNFLLPGSTMSRVPPSR